MNVVIWALLTGLITGGVWIGIVVFQHQRELDRYDADDPAAMERRLHELEQAVARVPELEERLEFAERLLAERGNPRLASEPVALATFPEQSL